jgi:hypothetical protein
MENTIKQNMNINTDNLEEVKQLLEYALEYRSWPSVEDALAIINEELGYENEEDTDSEEEIDEE